MPYPHVIKESHRYLKDIQRCLKRGCNLNVLNEFLILIDQNHRLPIKFRDHPLSGDYDGFREAHIEPDWLIIYLKTEETIYLARTGTHSDLFG